jgi:hypothetical protein
MDSNQASNTHHFASALHQYRVPPAPVHAANSFARANDSKSRLLVQEDAGLVLRKDSCLQRPDAVLLRRIDQCAQQLSSKPVAADVLGYVDAHLGHTSINAPARNRAQRGPAHDSALQTRHQPARRQVAFVPFFPFGRRLFERGIAGRDPLKINLAHRRPILFSHGRKFATPRVAHHPEV